MNLPNFLTIIRIAIVPAFVYYLLSNDGFFASLIALLLFVTATLTDLADGHLARKHDNITSFGIFMDPLADKILASSALISFVIQDHIAALPVILILVREFAITGLRIFGSSKKIDIPASWWPKFKTFLQLSLIILMLIYHTLIAGLATYKPEWLNSVTFDYKFYSNLYLWLTAIVTVWTGVSYLIQYRTIFKNSSK